MALAALAVCLAVYPLGQRDDDDDDVFNLRSRYLRAVLTVLYCT